MRSSLLLLVLIFAAYGQPPPKPDFSLSTDRLERVDRVLQKYIDDNRVAGVVALVLQDGKPAYERAFGWADKETGRKMTADTIFRIASQTKAFTSTAVLALMEEGKIGIVEPVSDFIPTFTKTTMAVKTAAGVDTQPGGDRNRKKRRLQLSQRKGRTSRLMARSQELRRTDL
jgi:CubicO group peptidase (beta-lactamase class C family)